MHPFWPTPLLSCGRGSSSWRSSSICFPNKPLSQTGRRADAAQPSIFPPFAAVQVRSIFNKSIKFSFAPRNQINRNRPQLLLLLLASSFSDSNSDVWASPWLHFCFGLCGTMHQQQSRWRCTRRRRRDWRPGVGSPTHRPRQMSHSELWDRKLKALV